MVYHLTILVTCHYHFQIFCAKNVSFCVSPWNLMSYHAFIQMKYKTKISFYLWFYSVVIFWEQFIENKPRKLVSMRPPFISFTFREKKKNCITYIVVEYSISTHLNAIVIGCFFFVDTVENCLIVNVPSSMV